MGIIDVILSVIFLSYRLGEEDGKWGCFTSIIVFFIILYFASKWS